MKKKKGIKKIGIGFFIVLLLVGIGTVGYFTVCNKEEKETEIQVKENQALLIAQITEINGNEITFAQAEEVDFSSDRRGGQNFEGAGSTNSNREESQKKGSIEKKSENKMSESGTSADETSEGGTSEGGMSEGGIPEGGMPEGGMPGGEMPGGEMPEGGMPEGGMPGGEMPEGGMPGGEMPGGGMPGGGMPEGGMPEGGMPGGGMSEDGTSEQNGSPENDSEEQSKKEKTNKVMYTITGEEETMLIPVGTSVTTQLGTKTTFSRLEAGDMVKILKETDENGKDVIVEIWMLQ